MKAKVVKSTQAEQVSKRTPGAEEALVGAAWVLNQLEDLPREKWPAALIQHTELWTALAKRQLEEIYT